ncbi:hypothetical protein CAPTEDRAFT_182381 [Capitella teleta]|uniref:U4/U6.U5 tri-snRNP-associated protein 1 n=1 Tax=Capitella teleta TaxID=283909 RepID=R7TRP9_CAPTE|nr:hypothetical protein CAPTEDRAFT_182381 [Capitella teleta]|eukprot:ELT94176.1 hypothetical protein CAPTEDRAFT_182381 [Capitella teleta]
MGSSKKHKEKDRDRDDKKRKRKHRSRSKSRDRDRKRDRREPREEEGRYRQEPSEDGEVEEHRREYDRGQGSHDTPQQYAGRQVVKDEPEESAFEEKQGGADLSLSVSETNKLRAKLGLKPLDTGDDAGTGDNDEQVTATKKEDVHVPAINLGKKRKEEALREKTAQAKQKRLYKEKLSKLKTLGESDSEEDTVSWVLKSRRIQTEKEEAAKRAKLLEEMDEEFGVGSLIEEEFGPTRRREYTSRDLKGIKVDHELDAFKEGKTVVLTLQDKGILDEDASDVLSSVNIMDDETAKRNLDNKKKRPDYNPYEGEEVDEYGMLKQREILGKYDEVLDGAKKQTFQLGSGGKYDAAHEKKMQDMRAAFKAKGETLSLPAPVVAKEFYSPNEMSEKFKKVKKKVRKIRKKPKVLTARDLAPLEGEHLGRRKGDTPIDKDIPKELIDKSGYIPGLDMDVDNHDPLDDSECEILGPEEDLTGVELEEDKAANELQMSLNKALKIKQKKRPDLNRLADRIVADEPDVDDEELSLNIRLNATSEFCRSLGEIPTYGQAGNREEEEDDLMDFEHELVEARRKHEKDEEANSGWHHVEIDDTAVEIKSEEKGVLDDEPVVNEGIAAALQLARKKGYLDHEITKQGKVNSNKHIDLEAKNYSIEDKSYNDVDDKYSRGKHSRYMGGGGGMEFKDKDGYKPEIKLEYVDDSGRNMTPKEAFRFLSHKFHGKGSGKKKTEKRMKKVEEEMLMKSMSSTDTPLNTVHLLLEKQKTEKTPYIVLSGSSKGGGALSK